MLKLAKLYNKSVQDEMKLTPAELKIRYVGKQDPTRHLDDLVEATMADNIVQNIGVGVDALVF